MQKIPTDIFLDKLPFKKKLRKRSYHHQYISNKGGKLVFDAVIQIFAAFKTKEWWDPRAPYMFWFGVCLIDFCDVDADG